MSSDCDHIVIKSTEVDVDGVDFNLRIPPREVGLEAIRYGEWGRTFDEHAWTVPWSASELLPLVTWYNNMESTEALDDRGIVALLHLLKFIGVAPDHRDVTMLERVLYKKFTKSTNIPYCREGDKPMGYKKLQQLLHFPVNMKNENGDTALHVASERGNSAAVEVLLSGGADPNILNIAGQTPLSTSIQSEWRNMSVVTQLLDSDATPDIRGDPRVCATPLYTACCIGLLPTVCALLVRRANPNIFSGQMSPLHIATIYGHTAVVGELLKHPEIEVHALTGGGGTAMSLAKKYKRDDIAKLLAKLLAQH